MIQPQDKGAWPNTAAYTGIYEMAELYLRYMGLHASQLRPLRDAPGPEEFLL